MADEPLISAEEVASVLSTENTEPEAPEGSNEFTLRRPVGIAASDEPEAKIRLEQFSREVTRALRQELDAEIEIEMKGFQQRQVRVALESMNPPVWVLSFVCAEGGGIALVLEAPCALALVEVTMGGLGSFKAEARKPTPLENRVISGLGRSLLKRLAKALPGDLVAAEFMLGAVPAQLAAPGETVGAGMLSLKIAEVEHRGYLLGSAGLLRDVEDEDEATSGHVGPMASRIAQVPVEARPLLRAGRASLADLVALKPGMVLRLEAREGTPLELRVAGESQIWGNVAHQDGQPVFMVEKIRGRSKPAATADRSAQPVEAEQQADGGKRP